MFRDQNKLYFKHDNRLYYWDITQSRYDEVTSEDGLYTPWYQKLLETLEDEQVGY